MKQESFLTYAKAVPIFRSETRLIFSLNNCYDPFQFGFRSNYSTNSALMSIVENIQTQLDNGEFAAGVFVDLRKAFDTVDHRILIQKLEYYGVGGISKKSFSSYLTTSKQFESTDNCNSKIKTILTGVPQGSVLGPLLFLIQLTLVFTNMVLPNSSIYRTKSHGPFNLANKTLIKYLYLTNLLLTNSSLHRTKIS